jgi:hypothetical protein
MPDTMLHPQFKDFDKFFVGFDDQFNRLAKMHDDLTKNVPNYPPFNIKKVEENKYVIENLLMTNLLSKAKQMKIMLLLNGCIKELLQETSLIPLR